MDKTLCPECMRMTEYDVVERPDMFEVRGERITVDARVAVCRTCGEDIGLGELDDATFRAAYAIYRARHDLLSPEQIKAIRTKYGLGQKAFARLLGWGDVTLARYESGSLQSASHDQALRLAEDPDTVRKLMERNASRLSPAQLAELRSHLAQLSADQEGILAREDSSSSYETGPSGDDSYKELRQRIAGLRDTAGYRTEQAIDSVTEAMAIRMEVLDLSRAELASRLGISPAQVTNLLRGSNNFTVRTLSEIATALGCDLVIDLVPREQDSSGEHREACAD